MSVRSEAFIESVRQLQEETRLTDGEVMSGCAGILIALCRENNTDPVIFLQWSLSALQKASS